MRYLSTIVLLLFIAMLSIINSCATAVYKGEPSVNDMQFHQLATRWDEAVPLGNGMVGSLIWNKNGKLRMSLDRADLWDLRPVEAIQGNFFKFKWIYKKWKENKYQEVQEKFDKPYSVLPAPTKIPAGALEFDVKQLGEVESVRLYVKHAVCEVRWKNGVVMYSFVHATKPIGWYRFEGINENIATELINPDYNGEKTSQSTDKKDVKFKLLGDLGYPEGKLSAKKNSRVYDQEGWGGFKYEVAVKWKQSKSILEGCWSISSEYPGWKNQKSAKTVVDEEISNGFNESVISHKQWWANFWAKCTIAIPDSILQKQWYLDTYKFGAAARKGVPPISLQAVWTADNGMIPPWKGDFHHDLNTQLSYWPAYSDNHLDLEEGYIDWLWKNKDTFKKYTKDFFEVDGLNVPGVCTLTGEPMGGWMQYSCSPTIAAWLGHHFYLHWQYSMDRNFLKEKAYPWISNVAHFLDEISVIGKNGKRKLPMSSSPEFFGNTSKAWFSEITNFDLSLIRWTFSKAAELAKELGKNNESSKWVKILDEWPELNVDKETGLTIAPNFIYEKSHRHFSHLMAFYPLGLIDYSNGKTDQQIIANTLKNLENIGIRGWTGYSQAWLGNLYARNFDGEKAQTALHSFIKSYCSINSFHINWKQDGLKKRSRPFTLEGNFAFASAIQEMLLQSHTGIVHLFPAIPKTWENTSFNRLRTVGAFLVSASKKNGKVTSVEVESKKGGVIKIKYPFNSSKYSVGNKQFDALDIIEIKMDENEKLILKPI